MGMNPGVQSKHFFIVFYQLQLLRKLTVKQIRGEGTTTFLLHILPLLPLNNIQSYRSPLMDISELVNLPHGSRIKDVFFKHAGEDPRIDFHKVIHPRLFFNAFP